ncbi:hypothetical protein GOODEAATRI_026568 [Goodea atripinnis]|uniref:Formin FH3 domain-containing protein n=1 Tax=Goodea atripinnis TaxID=208336 RepID=A0ABV0Q215_9TELE
MVTAASRLLPHLFLARPDTPSALVTRSNTLPSRRTLKNSRLVCKKDDVHVCVMCLRAIMNYQVCNEAMRFEKLMEHFKNEDDNIDFLVIVFFHLNIISTSNSVEDMNFRVHLQYDFTKLNLEEHLEMSERLLDVENEAMLKIVELEKQLMQTNKELDQLRVSAVSLKTIWSICMDRDEYDRVSLVDVLDAMLPLQLRPSSLEDLELLSLKEGRETEV